MTHFLSLLLKYLTALAVAFGFLSFSVQHSEWFSVLIGRTTYNDAYEGQPCIIVFGDTFTKWSPMGAALGAGLLVALLLWNKAERESMDVIIFSAILFWLVPLLFLNYMDNNPFFNSKIQWVVDFVCFMLGLLVLLKIFLVETRSVEGSLFKGLAVFFISSAAVILPGIYSILWHFNIQSLILSAKTTTVNSYKDVPNTGNFCTTWVTYTTLSGAFFIALFSCVHSFTSLQKSKVFNR